MGKAGMKVLRVFLAGVESRHWIPSLMVSNEDISCRSSVAAPACSKNIRGGWGGITHKAISGVSSHLPEIQGGLQLAIQAFGGSFSNADFPGREHDLPGLYRSDTIRGGFDQITHEDIHGGRDTVLREEKYRGGFDVTIKTWKPYILESFFYADADTERLMPYYGDFLLDSGAFTFMQGKGGSPDFDAYAERYADFINRNHVEKYFELDIDSVVGYDRVKQLRAKLERLTGRQSIPVWHKSRGKDEYIGLCKDYPYVALGGLVDGAKKGEYARALWKYFPWFIRTAHGHGAKIHALGFTSLEGIQQYHFDSVDSTAWTTGNRFGYLYFFDGKTMQKRDAPPGHRIANSRAAALHNYTEWIKFQKYADTHL